MIAQEPIKLPGSPFWNAFRSFGRDEAIALVINIIGTVIAAIFITNKFYLSIIGPIVEKIGFFPAHFKEAFEVYNTTPKDRRFPFRHYLKVAFKNGSVSLAKDIAIHDSCYVLLMYGGLTFYPQTPVWLLALSSFLIAVMIVAMLEVIYTEINYHLVFKNKLKRFGFDQESYYEARFFVSSTINPRQVMDRFIANFGLESIGQLQYFDSYWQANLPEFAGRVPQLRFRRRQRGNGSWLKTYQIVYTRADEADQGKLNQYRFFPIKKEKFYILLEPDATFDLSLFNQPWADWLRRLIFPDLGLQRIEFVREIARNDDLLVSVDQINQDQNYYIVEIKTHRNIILLIEAMRLIMQEFPSVQTTSRKLDLF